MVICIFQAICMKRKLYSFSNTCAFDSILQTFLVAAIDNPKIENCINNLRCTRNPTLDLIIHIKKNGTQTAYRKRGMILQNLILMLDPKRMHEINGAIEVDCTINVYSLAQRFADLPSCKVSLKCNKNCPTKVREVRNFILANKMLCESASGISIYKNLKESTICDRSECLGIVEKTYEASGNSLQLYFCKKMNQILFPSIFWCKIYILLQDSGKYF